MDGVVTRETVVRLTCFGAVFVIMALWEVLAPCRVGILPRGRRWPGNLGILLVDVALVRLLMPLLAVEMAVLSVRNEWGLFNAVGVPGWLAFMVSFLALDLLVYGQHVMFHKVPWFWRLHRMHHTDTGFDVTTGLRFHPLEILLSMLLKIAAVGLLGAPVLAVLIFEVVLNATALFNHGNVRLPAALEPWIRACLVTPDMHRVHHSIHPDEFNSNFGFNLSWWDRLFGTWTDQPRDGHRQMMIGLEQFRDHRSVEVHWLLAQPFLKS